MRVRQVTPHHLIGDLETGHFKMGRGYATWRPDGTDDWLLIYTISGLGRFGFRNADRSMEERFSPPGSITLLRPRTLHDYGVEPTQQWWELLWAHFRPRAHWHELLRLPVWSPLAPGLFHLALCDDRAKSKVLSRFRDVHRLRTRASPQSHAFAMNALEEVLLWCDTYNPLRSDWMDERLQLAMDRATAHIGAALTVGRLAELAGLSESRFAHLFKQTLGISPQRWIERTRLARARQLLELTTIPVKQIAREVGYTDPLYFSRRFALAMQSGPRAYRTRLLARKKRPIVGAHRRES